MTLGKLGLAGEARHFVEGLGGEVKRLGGAGLDKEDGPEEFHGLAVDLPHIHAFAGGLPDDSEGAGGVVEYDMGDQVLGLLGVAEAEHLLEGV